MNDFRSTRFFALIALSLALVAALFSPTPALAEGDGATGDVAAPRTDASILDLDAQANPASVSLAKAVPGTNVLLYLSISNDATAAGQTIRNITITNNLGVELDDGTWHTHLEPRQEALTFGRYELTQADIDRGRVDATFDAQGTLGSTTVTGSTSLHVPIAQNPQVSLTIDAPAEVTVDGTHATPDVPTTVTATNTGNVTLTNLQLTSHDGNALVWDGNGTALAPGETVTGTAVIPASGLTSSDDKDADVVATVRGQRNELTAEDSDADTVTIVRAPSKPATDEPGSDTGAGGSGTTGDDRGRLGRARHDGRRARQDRPCGHGEHGRRAISRRQREVADGHGHKTGRVDKRDAIQEPLEQDA